jgi:AraC-like DNA-binding protein
MTPHPSAAGARAWRATTITRHQSDRGRWELATARPAPCLQPFVRDYVGWNESHGIPLCRRELPTDIAPLILNFGDAFRLFAPGSAERATTLRSFMTGAYDTYQLVESAGSSEGVQVNLTLLGARLLIGRPIDDMTNRAGAPEDVLGPFAHELTARVHEAADWDARFDWLDHALMTRIATARPVPEAVHHAWQRIVASAGRVSIRSVVAESGWSQAHFIRQFRHNLGVSPKVLARMLRFGRVVESIRRDPQAHLLDLALDAGYYDQSHLTRDVRDFAGITPGALVRSLLPVGGGLSACQFRPS